MRVCAGIAMLAVAALTAVAGAQNTLDWPVEQREAMVIDSGVVSNNTGRAATGFAQIVHVRDTGWIRLYFDDVTLDEGSYLRVTSLLDLEQQILDGKTIAMWGNTTAYFNGDMVLVELVAGPRSAKNRFRLAEVGRNDIHDHGRGSSGECGICGGSDDRVPSSENWSCRLFPAGCTASVWNQDSCLVSAGHCIGGSMVIQFNVPSSNGNCSTNNPPIADQFPIIQEQSVNGGVGNDWAVMVPGTNNLGQLPYDRYGEFRPIATSGPGVGQTNEMYGYGVDNTCTRSQTQQFHAGPISQVFSTFYTYSIDLRGGNSGSALIRNGEILGIATHCPCPNVATRVDHPSFASARDALCPESQLTCGDPGTGSCFEPHATPVCDDGQCCTIVCLQDPFCCDTEWDQQCVDAALANCTVSSEAELLQLKVKRGTVTGGGLNSLENSDNVRLVLASYNAAAKKQVNIQVWTRTTVPAQDVQRLDVNVEFHCDVPDIKTRVQLRNFVDGGWLTLSNDVTPTSDTMLSFPDIPNPEKYVRSNGQIRLRFRPAKKNIPGFNFLVDEVETIIYE